MKVFHYHRETGAFLGEGEADLSPLEPDVWLIPAYATAKKPPKASKGKQAVWVDDSWELQLIPEPAPEPAPEMPQPQPAPVLTPAQKLEATGLTVAELKILLGIE